MKGIEQIAAALAETAKGTGRLLQQFGMMFPLRNPYAERAAYVEQELTRFLLNLGEHPSPEQLQAHMRAYQAFNERGLDVHAYCDFIRPKLQPQELSNAMNLFPMLGLPEEPYEPSKLKKSKHRANGRTRKQQRRKNSPPVIANGSQPRIKEPSETFEHSHYHRPRVKHVELVPGSLKVGVVSNPMPGMEFKRLEPINNPALDAFKREYPATVDAAYEPAPGKELRGVRRPDGSTAQVGDVMEVEILTDADGVARPGAVEYTPYGRELSTLTHKGKAYGLIRIVKPDSGPGQSFFITADSADFELGDRVEIRHDAPMALHRVIGHPVDRPGEVRELELLLEPVGNSDEEAQAMLERTQSMNRYLRNHGTQLSPEQEQAFVNFFKDPAAEMAKKRNKEDAVGRWKTIVEGVTGLKLPALDPEPGPVVDITPKPQAPDGATEWVKSGAYHTPMTIDVPGPRAELLTTSDGSLALVISGPDDPVLEARIRDELARYRDSGKLLVINQRPDAGTDIQPSIKVEPFPKVVIKAGTPLSLEPGGPQVGEVAHDLEVNTDAEGRPMLVGLDLAKDFTPAGGSYLDYIKDTENAIKSAFRLSELPPSEGGHGALRARLEPTPGWVPKMEPKADTIPIANMHPAIRKVLQNHLTPLQIADLERNEATFHPDIAYVVPCRDHACGCEDYHVFHLDCPLCGRGGTPESNVQATDVVNDAKELMYSDPPTPLILTCAFCKVSLIAPITSKWGGWGHFRTVQLRPEAVTYPLTSKIDVTVEPAEDITPPEVKARLAGRLSEILHIHEDISALEGVELQTDYDQPEALGLDPRVHLAGEPVNANNPVMRDALQRFGVNVHAGFEHQPSASAGCTVTPQSLPWLEQIADFVAHRHEIGLPQLNDQQVKALMDFGAKYGADQYYSTERRRQTMIVDCSRLSSVELQTFEGQPCLVISSPTDRDARDRFMRQLRNAIPHLGEPLLIIRQHDTLECAAPALIRVLPDGLQHVEITAHIQIGEPNA